MSLITSLVIVVALLMSMTSAQSNVTCDQPSSSFYSLSGTLINGTKFDFNQLQNKVVLIVNTASFDDMTNDTYINLNLLMDKFGPQEFAILGFTSAQFNNEEPGHNNQQVLMCLKHVCPGRGYEPNFQLFEKTDVNGPSTSPVFAWLKSGCGPSSPTLMATDLISWTPVLYNDIEGNFAKFLISKTGTLFARFSIDTLAQDLSGVISSLLSQ
ncbi:hypothetical protein SAMD00019534_084580 [Acytostelium subglobosum LB1]|uniref:hypothetical protein n=1 Tax=Acytostelium subglobosum LB1 TaxID=1410327 RepID=UPI000644DFD5|nr:hypothetical protein SAMD00019534_084580 [Acytostelium subglobosum LB1]GAM25283.1 hypothetical protein SAMD00019534_084580 [Acytostelium subglobosum LB1]|eukprot:XP_012751803.1 hypothetical protein SAMD00019534_084580 [Acytostelium subglobosum LB1]